MIAFPRLSPIPFLLFLISIPYGTQAQGDWCGTDERRKAMIEEMGKARFDQAYERTTQEIGQRAAPDTIPVVVHVLHKGGAGNISYEQVKDGIRVLNKDFNRENADSTDTRPLFDSLAADSRIYFRLARFGPDSQCTNGVTRTYTDLTSNANNAVKELIRWPTHNYLNIWLANKIQNSGNNTVLGYADFPFNGIDENYGVVMRNDRWGRFGTSNSEGRTATHEVGHCLGLFHTFQPRGGCAGGCSSSGDRVCDTPPSYNETFGCDQTQNTCSNDTQGSSPYSTDVVDQIENYMSYDNCQNMFSKGQKGVMKGALNNITGLQTLTSSSNLEATGVHKNPLCKADFSADRKIVCSGDTVSFTGHSYHNVQERTWIFYGGDPFFKIGDKNPEIVYPNPGLYDVELEVRQGNDSLSIKKEGSIRVLEAVGVPTPYQEDMEADPIAGESIFPRASRDGIEWVHTDRTGASGHSSLVLENYLATKGGTYSFETRTIDASSDSAIAISFKVAYRRKDANDNDELRIYASSSCGDVWDLRGAFGANELANGDPQPSYYEAEGAQWRTFSVIQSLSTGYNVENLRFKFQFESDGGNNIYIDDINVAAPSELSIPEKKGSFGVRIFPNPADHKLFFRTDRTDPFSYSLKDASGRTLRTERVEGGGQERSIDVKGLAPGLYFLHFRRNGARDQVRKVMIR